ncbi:MAG: aminotransferase class I/II-fold pyridoxal phosphate-dependent enzyme [Armatimonadetes bacterium]|nr:aminotransferase class I/II-fold pyridoxal phosphate-dependent enzyme [Armatimonadota bacterium]
MTSISKNVQSVSASGIRKFFDIVAEMKDVISLGVGEPDFVTPWRMREACIYSLEQGRTNYTSNWGLLELRQLIAQHLQNLYKVSYTPENEILVTVGVSEALDLALRAIVDPGDEVILFEPCYVSYAPCVTFAGGVPVTVETSAETGFVPSLEAVRKAITPRTKAIMLSYPSNPTGATADRKSLQDIVNLAREADIFIISDEIYDRLTYVGEHVCVSSLEGARERTILLNGFSKAYAMTGWRIGYACAPPEVAESMMKIHQYVALCAPITAQETAIEALSAGEQSVQDMRAEYNMRRRLIVKRFNDCGLSCSEPRGAFYAFPSVKKTGLSSEEFSERLLHSKHVVVVPGNAFGASGEGYVRAAYATSFEKIEEAMQRIGEFVESLPQAVGAL